MSDAIDVVVHTARTRDGVRVDERRRCRGPRERTRLAALHRHRGVRVTRPGSARAMDGRSAGTARAALRRAGPRHAVAARGWRPMSAGQLGAALVACAAGYGVHLVYTGTTHGWTGIGPGPRTNRVRLAAVGPRIRAASARPVAAGLAGAAAGFVLFGTPMPALLGGVFAAAIAAMSSRAEAEHRLERVADAWPGVLEEMRVLAGAGGRPLPHALFHAGRRTPPAISVGFAAAEREWQSSTDFARALAVLKTELAEASTDVICETLLVAHQVGGTRGRPPARGAGRRPRPRSRSAPRRPSHGRRAHASPVASCSWCRSGWRSSGCRSAPDAPRIRDEVRR